MTRLLRQERLVAANTIRATFGSWHDRAIAALMLVAALAVVHAWFAERPWTVAAWTAFAAGAALGIGTGRLVATRLAFHAFDGLLAVDALRPRARRRYALAWHGMGLGLLAATTLVARPSMLVASLPGYLGGAIVAGSTGALDLPLLVTGWPRPGWTIRAWSRRPVAGVLAAAVVLLPLLPLRALGPDALAAVAGVGSVLLALSLSGVDDATVRFMAYAGYPSPRIVAAHARGLASFAAIAAPGCWIVVGPVPAGLVAAACAAALLLLVVRILAYRLHTKRFADLLVSVVAGLLALTAYAMPPAFPVMALAVLWRLERRGRARTWLLA